MRHVLVPSLVAATLALLVKNSYSSPSPNFLSAVTTPLVTPDQSLSLDKSIRGLFKDERTNVFADLTQLPFDPKNPSGINKIIPISPRSTPLNFAASHNLLVDVSGEHTFLFRYKPNVERLLELILAEQKRIDAKYSFDEKATITEVRAFYAQQYGWNPAPTNLEEKKKAAQGAGEKLRLIDFPPALAHQLEGAYINEVRTTSSDAYYQYFDLANWKKSRVRLEKWKEGIIGDSPFRNASVVVLYPGEGILNFLVGLPHLQKQSWSQGSPPKARVILTGATTDGDTPVALTTAGPKEGAQPPSVEVPSSEFGADVRLQKQVSFDVGRVPLHKFISDLTRQADVSLALAPEFAKNKTLVAHSAGMTLAETMKALARLYVGHWAKNGQSYTLTPDSVDELHLLMAQLGNNAYYGYSPLTAVLGRAETGAELADEIYGEADPNQLYSKEGIAFVDLPDDLQGRLVQLYRDTHTANLVIMQQRLIDALSQDIRVVFAPLSAKEIPTFFGAARTQRANFGTLGVQRAGLAAFTSDGRFIAQLLEGFKIWPPAPPSEADRWMEERRKADQEWVNEQWVGPGNPALNPDETSNPLGQPN